MAFAPGQVVPTIATTLTPEEIAELPVDGRTYSGAGTYDPRWAKMLRGGKFYHSSKIESVGITLSYNRFGQPVVRYTPKKYCWPRVGAVLMVPWAEDWAGLEATYMPGSDRFSPYLVAQKRGGGPRILPRFVLYTEDPAVTATRASDQSVAIASEAARIVLEQLRASGVHMDEETAARVQAAMTAQTGSGNNQVEAAEAASENAPEAVPQAVPGLRCPYCGKEANPEAKDPVASLLMHEIHCRQRPPP